MQKSTAQIHEDVYRLLLAPIKVKKSSQIVYNPETDFIESGQTYWAAADEDMSDFSIGFYDILYRGILNGHSILDGKNLLDTDFAGDTMNSFNTVANLFTEVGKSEAKRNLVPMELWPKELREYKHNYHCLANFWLIPMDLGRTIKPGSKSKTSLDYMDRFLEVYRTDIRKYGEEYPRFCAQFTGFDDFVKRQFLNPGYITDDGQIPAYSQTRNGTAIIEAMTEKIRIRAEAISNSEYVYDLWKYFAGLGLIK